MNSLTTKLLIEESLTLTHSQQEKSLLPSFPFPFSTSHTIRQIARIPLLCCVSFAWFFLLAPERRSLSFRGVHNTCILSPSLPINGLSFPPSFPKLRPFYAGVLVRSRKRTHVDTSDNLKYSSISTSYNLPSSSGRQFLVL